MSWFSKIFSSVDNLANSINPMKDPMKDLTDATVSKVYKPAGQLYDFSNSHPLESGLVMLGTGAAAGALGGGAAAAGEAGAAGAADATAMGGAAGTLGAADSAAASAGLGYTAADVAGGAALGDTAMGSAAGLLGAADSSAASADMGLTAADVGGDAFVGPGGGADLLMGGGGGFDPYANVSAGDFNSVYGGGAPSTSSGFGGVGTDPSVAASPDGGLALGQGGAGTAATSPTDMQSLLKTALKYGPLGMSLLKGAMGKNEGVRAQAAYNNVGSQQRQTASGLVSAYNNGTLNPAESAGIDKWATQQVAALRQFYANSGTADSTQAKQAEAQIMAQATQMKNQASQNLLKVGMDELNSLDANTRAGIAANLQGDQAAQAAQANFAATFAKLIGSTGQTPTTAPAGP